MSSHKCQHLLAQWAISASAASEVRVPFAQPGVSLLIRVLMAVTWRFAGRDQVYVGISTVLRAAQTQNSRTTSAFTMYVRVRFSRENSLRHFGTFTFMRGVANLNEKNLLNP